MIEYPNITVNVEYNPDERKEEMGFDNMLDEIAKKHGGEHSGGGFMIGTGMRDQDLRFFNLKSARNFVLAVQRFDGVHKITSHCMLHRDDYDY